RDRAQPDPSGPGAVARRARAQEAAACGGRAAGRWPASDGRRAGRRGAGRRGGRAMSHLGRWLSALVDGELDPAERDRVLNHLAGCRSCLREANEMRALKRRLTALGDSSDDGAIAGRMIELVRSEQGSFGRFAPTRWPGERGKVRMPGRRLIRPGWMRQTQVT